MMMGHLHSNLEVNVIASGSRGNTLWLSDGETQLLIDCGVKYRTIQEALNFMTTDIAACLVSHEHFDHCKSANDVKKAGIDIYTGRETADKLGLDPHYTTILNPKQYFYIGTWTGIAFSLVHDVPNLGFLLESKYGPKLIYLTDTAYCSYRFKNLTHIFLGVNYDPELMNSDNPAKTRHVLEGHMSIDTAKDFIAKNYQNSRDTLEAIYLLHLSAGNSDAEKFKKEMQKLTGVPVYIEGES